MTTAEIKLLAKKWIDAWNTGDLQVVMEYYADDIELYSPFVVDRWKIEEGKIIGKQKVREHFAKTFEASPVRNLELLEVLFGIKSFIVVYKNKKEIVSADLIELDNNDKVKSVKVYYNKK